MPAIRKVEILRTVRINHMGDLVRLAEYLRGRFGDDCWHQIPVLAIAKVEEQVLSDGSIVHAVTITGRMV